MKEMIYLNEKTGQHQKNLEIWEKGHQKGYFFLLSPRIPKYEPYLEYAKFDELVSRDEFLRSDAFKESQTIYEVVLPEKYDATRKYPLLIIFHGGGSNLNRSRNSWEIVPPLNADFITIYLQSYRCMDSNTYGWLSADERAHQELKGCFDELIKQYPVDLSSIYLSGISAGATMALDVAFSGTLPVRGVIAFCPGMPRNMTIESIVTTQPKVYMLAGENDFYRPKQQELIDLFQKTGIDYTYNIIPGMGHEFPGDYEHILQESLKYVMRP
jgi:predicted esterase